MQLNSFLKQMKVLVLVFSRRIIKKFLFAEVCRKKCDMECERENVWKPVEARRNSRTCENALSS